MGPQPTFALVDMFSHTSCENYQNRGWTVIPLSQAELRHSSVCLVGLGLGLGLGWIRVRIKVRVRIKSG